MGIREEIKRLRGIAHYDENDSYISKADVLSILDEHLGELAGEHTFKSKELAELDILDGPCPPGQARTIEFYTGDNISIYVRRKK